MNNEIVKVYGSNWCGDCFRAKRLLDKHQVDYQWINIDSNHDAKELVRQVNKGKIVVPMIVFQDGSELPEPTNGQLRKKLA